MGMARLIFIKRLLLLDSKFIAILLFSQGIASLIPIFKSQEKQHVENIQRDNRRNTRGNLQDAIAKRNGACFKNQ